MTLTDGIILGLVIIIVSAILCTMFKKRGKDVCERCAYAKNCTDVCTSKKKTMR